MLGLGSLIGDRDRDPDTVNQSEGASGTGVAASGGSESVQATDQTEQRGFGSAWWQGILALVVFFLLRRARRKTHRR